MYWASFRGSRTLRKVLIQYALAMGTRVALRAHGTYLARSRPRLAGSHSLLTAGARCLIPCLKRSHIGRYGPLRRSPSRRTNSPRLQAIQDFDEGQGSRLTRERSLVRTQPRHPSEPAITAGSGVFEGRSRFHHF
jgi:hypothetical protein